MFKSNETLKFTPKTPATPKPKPKIKIKEKEKEKEKKEDKEKKEENLNLNIKIEEKEKEKTPNSNYSSSISSPQLDESIYINQRPNSRLSLSSTPCIFKRIKFGMSMRTGSSSSLISYLERIAPPSRSTSSIYSNLTESNEINQNQEKSNSPLKLKNSFKNSSTILKSHSNFGLQKDPQHQTTMKDSSTKSREQSKERKPQDTTTRFNIPRSYSDASVAALNICQNNNSYPSIQPKLNSSHHQNRYALTDHQPSTSNSHHHHHHLRSPSPNKLRRRKHSASTSSTPTPTTQLNIDPPPSKSSKPKVLERLNDQETEKEYLTRLGEKVQRSKIPSLLASSNQPFHLSALTKFMSTFEFSHDPIDLSIRKLLMTVDLPPETQQIDRVIESFAKRYTECNPKLFKDPDQVYILAFSIIMLHTDAFNKSNKAKMTRADYVKNTRMDGITREFLEYIYDNITYAPFIYVESNKLDFPANFLSSTQHLYDNTSTSLFNLTGSNPLTIIPAISPAPNNLKTKLDPYQWISEGRTHELRPDLGSVIPSRNPFSFTGSVPWFDFKRLRDSFSSKKSVMIQIVNPSPSKPNAIFKQIESEEFLFHSCNTQHHQHFISPTLNSPKQPDYDLTSTTNDSTNYHNRLQRPSSRLQHVPPPPSSPDVFLNLRAIKVGLIHLKIDLPFHTSSNQSNNSNSNTESHLIHDSNLTRSIITKKWKLFCVLLSAGQLILIKDFGLIDDLQESIRLAGIKNQSNPDDQLVVRITGLKPDVVLSLDGAIALMDSTYKRRPCAFRLILSKNLSILMALNANDEMDSWITHINYAAAHKTHRIPFRSCDHHRSSSRPTCHSANDDHVTTSIIPHVETHSKDRSSFESLLLIPKPSRESTDLPLLSRSTSIANMLSRSQAPRRSSLLGPSTSPMINDYNSHSRSPERMSSVSHRLSIPTRYDIIRAAILNIEAQIHASKKHLNEDLRLARNLAVLTPFQLATRSRLHQAIIPIADRVRSSRYLLSKWVCYREILIKDFPSVQTLSWSSVYNAPATTNMESSVKSRPNSPTRPTLEKEIKDPTVASLDSAGSDNHSNDISVAATTSALKNTHLDRHTLGNKRQKSMGDVLDLDSFNLSSSMEKNEIKNKRRTSLGERFQKVSSINTTTTTTTTNNNNNKFEISSFKQISNSNKNNNKSVESNDQSVNHETQKLKQPNHQQLDQQLPNQQLPNQQQPNPQLPNPKQPNPQLLNLQLPNPHLPNQQQQKQQPRRYSGTFITPPVKARYGPLATSLRKSCDLRDVQTSRHTVRGTQTNNQDSRAISASAAGIGPIPTNSITTSPVTNNNSTDASNRTRKPESNVLSQQSSDDDDDDELIKNTTLRKVGRHRSEDYSDVQKPMNHHHHHRGPSFSKASRSSTVNTFNTWRSIEPQQNHTEPCSISPQIGGSMANNYSQEHGFNNLLTPSGPSSSLSRNLHNIKATRSLSRSFSKFPKGLLLSSSSSSSKPSSKLNQSTDRKNHWFNKHTNGSIRGSIDGRGKKSLNSDKEDENGNVFNKPEAKDDQVPQTTFMIKLGDQTNKSPMGLPSPSLSSSTSHSTPPTNRSRMMMKAKLAESRNSHDHRSEPILDPSSFTTPHGRILIASTSTSKSAMRMSDNNGNETGHLASSSSHLSPPSSSTNHMGVTSQPDPQPSSSSIPSNPLHNHIRSDNNNNNSVRLRQSSSLSSIADSPRPPNLSLQRQNHSPIIHHNLHLGNPHRFTNAWGLP